MRQDDGVIVLMNPKIQEELYGRPVIVADREMVESVGTVCWVTMRYSMSSVCVVSCLPGCCFMVLSLQRQYWMEPKQRMWPF